MKNSRRCRELYECSAQYLLKIYFYYLFFLSLADLMAANKSKICVQNNINVSIFIHSWGISLLWVDSMAHIFSCFSLKMPKINHFRIFFLLFVWFQHVSSCFSSVFNWNNFFILSSFSFHHNRVANRRKKVRFYQISNSLRAFKNLFTLEQL